MSFDNLPSEVRARVLKNLEDLGGKSKLELDGSATVSVNLNVTVSFDIEFDSVLVAEGSRFEVQLRKAKLENPIGSELFPAEQEPKTVIHIIEGDRSTLDRYDLTEIISDHLDYEIRQKAEESIDTGYGVNLEYAEVEDIDVQDIFIENEDDLEAWNSDDDEELV